ncbi:putative lysine-specific demethylase JMJ16 isoform X2 [Apium graveolens]
MENPSINDTAEKLSVPPGFVSLTTFTLRRSRANRESCSPKHNGIECHQKPASSGISSDIIESSKYKKSPGARPWIVYNQPSHDADEIESERIPTNHDSKTSLPNGLLRCGDCLKVTASWQPEAAQIPVVEEAPVFYPTEEEFEDTLNYVANIRRKAERYGICRIVPPPSWKPPELLKRKKKWETEKFSTYVQEVDELKDRCSQRIIHRITANIKGKMRTAPRMGIEYGLVGGCNSDSDEVEYCHEGLEFERGPDFTLDTFKKYADHFKDHYFCKKHKELNADANLSVLSAEHTLEVKDIEGEYWRIIENPTAKIEVLCCDDLDSRTFGSGFPLSSNPLETQNHLKYIESGWNLNNTANLPGSLLAFENHNTSVASIPRLHIGMCLSSHCWKVEDHHLYSLCYMHFGAPKIWYGIPGIYLFKFEAALKRKNPHLSEHPELLYKLATQLSLSSLESEGIPLYRCVQLQGEFLLIFPGAYYSGIDCGFNCSEAVNFAPFDWLPHGQNVVELYSGRRRKTSVSHDKLLLHAAIEAVKALWELTMKKKNNSAHILHWTSVCGEDGILAKALKSRYRQERRRREFLCNSSRFEKVEKDFDSTLKRECFICLYDLHLSAASCPCSPGRYACLQHAKQLCSCAWSDRVFHYQYKSSDLYLLVEALERRSIAVYKWASENLEMSVDFNVPNDASPRALVLDNVLTSADKSEKAEHTEPQAHNPSAGPASVKLKDVVNRTIQTLASKDAMNPLQQTLSSTASLNKSSLAPSSIEADPKVSSNGKVRSITSLEYHQHHPDNVVASADKIEKAKHTEPRAHNPSAAPASVELKDVVNRTIHTLASRDAMNPLQQTLASSASLNISSVVPASTADLKFSSSGKERFIATSLMDHQHHPDKGLNIAKIPRTSSAQSPLSQIFLKKHGAEQSSSPHQAKDFIVLSDDD